MNLEQDSDFGRFRLKSSCSRVKRFPVGLTLAAGLVLALLINLGLWQLRRLDETTANRAKIAALAGANAVALDVALKRGGVGPALDHVRVSVDCLPGPPVNLLRYAVRGGDVAWRLLSLCRLAGGQGETVLVDRGVVSGLAHAMTPQPATYPEPAHLVGVLRKLGARPWLGNSMGPGEVRVVDAETVDSLAANARAGRPIHLYLAVERETPQLPGVVPAALAEDTPRDNFGYALTWFGLAIALVAVWAAMVWRRLKGT